MALTTVKIVVLAPIPSARERMAMALNPGFLIRIRRAKRTSCQKVCTAHLSRARRKNRCEHWAFRNLTTLPEWLDAANGLVAAIAPECPACAPRYPWLSRSPYGTYKTKQLYDHHKPSNFLHKKPLVLEKMFYPDKFHTRKEASQ